MARLQAGDHDALGVLVVRYRETMCAVAQHAGLNRDDAEDAVQIAFMRVLERSHQCQGNVRGWMLTIVRNVALDMRKQPHWKRKHTTIQRDDPIYARGRSPLGSILLKERDALLRKTVWSLRSPYREYLIEKYWYGMTLIDMAEKYGIQVGAMKMRLTRARRMVRQLYKFR